MILVLQVTEVEVVKVKLDVAIEVKLSLFPLFCTLFCLLLFSISNFLYPLDGLLVQ